MFADFIYGLYYAVVVILIVVVDPVVVWIICTMLPFYIAVVGYDGLWLKMVHI